MKELAEYPDLMTTAEVALVTGLSRRTILRMIRDGELPARGGRIHMVPKSVLPAVFTPTLEEIAPSVTRT